MAAKLLIKIKEFAAHGGPSTKTMGGDGHEMTPTQSGRFVIAKIEKHISYGKYALWSGVPWGAGLKFSGDVTYIDIGNKGLWQRLSAYRPLWLKEYGTEDAIKKNILDYWKEIAFVHNPGTTIPLYRLQNPDKWVFNDFGHVSVKYFRDTNHNGILDRNEQILGDFIHTTPGDEATSFFNKTQAATLPKTPINLPGSHGCIHVKPDEIDAMISSGYLKKGQSIVVHPYNDLQMTSNIKADRYTRAGYEAHFFPGLYKIAIYKVS